MKYSYEIDCTECDEGVLQWTREDEIAICDHCDHEMNLNEYSQEYWNSNYVEC